MTEILVVLIIIVIFFGGKKIPELMRGLGRGVREFKDAMEKPTSDTTTPTENTDKKADGNTPEQK